MANIKPKRAIPIRHSEKYFYCAEIETKMRYSLRVIININTQIKKKTNET